MKLNNPLWLLALSQAEDLAVDEGAVLIGATVLLEVAVHIDQLNAAHEQSVALSQSAVEAWQVRALAAERELRIARGEPADDPTVAALFDDETADDAVAKLLEQQKDEIARREAEDDHG